MMPLKKGAARAALLAMLLFVPAAARAQAPALVRLPAAGQRQSLDAIRRAVGDARIVLLAETSAGDGATLAAKARIVRMLHAELGFDVLAFESGELDMARVDAALDRPGPLIEASNLGLARLWAQSTEVDSLLGYVRASRKGPKPIALAGIDAQISAGDPSLWAQDVIAALRRAGVSDHELGRFSNINQALHQGTGAGSVTVLRALVEELPHMQQLFAGRRAALDSIEGKTRAELLGRSLEDAAVQYDLMEAGRSGRGSGTTADANPRERRMGDNLLWLLHYRFPARKIVVWLSSQHALHVPAEVFDSAGAPYLPRVSTAGSMVKAALQDEVFTLAFTAASGAYGDILTGRRQGVPLPVAGSIEAACRALAPADAFVALKGSRSRFTSHLLDYRPLTARWGRQVDGIYCIQEMRPALRLGARPPEF